MSKLSFRARALDASKPLPIYLAEEIPDPADCSLINRAVPQMPTGMEKEEEAEHHLQQAIVAGTVIPTPEVFLIDNVDYYDKIYPEDYKLPRQLIYMQPFSMETDIPDYDMDSEDEQWVLSQLGKLELTPDKFEEMMDRLEKGSGQTVVTLQEAKALIKEDDDLIIAVYDYWLNKRLKTQQPLIPHVRTEARHGVANHNPYIAFRRRTEKMQTRKNRKNDESSYEKMLKLRRDLSRAVNLLEMVKKREKSKRELLHLTIEVFEKRTQAGDFSGQIVSEALQQRPVRPAFTPLFPNSLSWFKEDPHHLASLSRKERRQYKKRRHKSSSKSHAAASAAAYVNAQGLLSLDGDGLSSEDDLLPASPSDGDEEDEGHYTFRRKKNCEYLAPVDNSEGPFYSQEEIDQRVKFYPTSISDLKNGGYRPVGPCRRRVGRGGRILLDRMSVQDLRELCRVMGYDPSKSFATSNSPSPSSSKAPKSPSQSSQPQSDLPSSSTSDPSSSSAATATVTTPTPTEPLPATSQPPTPQVQIKQEIVEPEPPLLSPVLPQPDPLFASVVEEEEQDYSTAPLGCWHHFRPKTPDPIDTSDWLMISDPSEEPSSDMMVEDHESILGSTNDFLNPSYHLGLIVSSGDRPLSYPMETLLADPSFDEDNMVPLPSSVETPGKHVVLDEQTSELENTYYLMEYNNEFLNVDDVETDTWFSSMDVDSGLDSTSSLAAEEDNNKFEPPSNQPPSSSSGSFSGPPPPPASGPGTQQQQHNNLQQPHQNSAAPPPGSGSDSSQGQGTNSNSSPPQTNHPDSSPETTVVNVKSGEETDGGKNETDSSKARGELNRFALLISV